MVRKKVKKTPVRSKKNVSSKKEVQKEFGIDLSAFSTADLFEEIRERAAGLIAHEATQAKGEATAPVNQASPAPIAAGQTIGNQEANSCQPPKTLPEELQALHERMMVAFAPEMQAIEKRFGYSAFYRARALSHLGGAVRSMAAACAEHDPRRASGQPLWWDSREDEVIAKELYSRLAGEMSSLRQLAKVRKPEAFDARQFSPFSSCFPATNS